MLKGVVDNISMSASQTVSYKVWQRERNSDDTHPHTMVVVVTESSEASRLQGKSQLRRSGIFPRKYPIHNCTNHQKGIQDLYS